MPSTLQVNSGWLLGSVCSIMFMILYPLVMAALVHRRWGVSWRFFGYGALIFLLFQIISRVPLVALLQSRLAPELQASNMALVSWYVVLALSAGVFEEVGRYIGYRWLVKRENWTWRVGVMYGLGHGGLESMLLVGGLTLLTLLNLLVLSSANLNALPASTHAQVVQQFVTINSSPVWTSLLGAWERLWMLPLHVALSVIVLQALRRSNIGWLLLAIVLHAAVDFTSVFLPFVLGHSLNTNLLLEGAIAVVGVVSIWIIWRLRDAPAVARTDIATSGPGDTPYVG